MRNVAIMAKLSLKGLTSTRLLVQPVTGTGIFFSGAIAQGVWDGSPPVQSSDRGLGRRVPQKLKQFADIVYIYFNYRNDQNLKISHNSSLDF